jgi:hypothetical protein
MRRGITVLGFAAVAFVLVGSAAFAQSSGSFGASFNTTACAITDSTGVLTGGIAGNSLPPVSVKVSSGSGVALLITPSLVTGLFTDNKVTQTSTTSIQNIGLQVTVTVDNDSSNVVPELGVNPGIIYDQRFIQVKAPFLSQLSACGGDGTCFELVESTLSAHSFNFYVSNLSPGQHEIEVSWSLIGGGSGEAACVGPGTLTVQQVKNFSFNSPISF